MINFLFRVTRTPEGRLFLLLLAAACFLMAQEASSCGGHLVEGDTISAELLDYTISCHYTFEVMAGDVITVQMTPLDETLDPFITLRDPDWQALLSDNDSGGDRTSFIDHYQVVRSGTYTIVAGAYRGETIGAFELSLVIEHPASCGASLSPGKLVWGVRSPSALDCVYQLAGEAGDSITVFVESPGSPQAPAVQLLDPTGKVENASGEDDGNSQIVYHPLAHSGIYTVVVGASEDQQINSFVLVVAQASSFRLPLVCRETVGDF